MGQAATPYFRRLGKGTPLFLRSCFLALQACARVRRMRMSRKQLSILIYLLPALADLVVAQFIFINAVRLSQQGASATIVANTLTVWSLVYLLSCPVIGRVVSEANAARLMLIAMSSLTVISLLFTVIPNVTGVYILMALAGLAAALFFLPFQVFMKAVDGANQKPLTYSTGLYTFAWSMGFAVGPFVSGLLMELGTPATGGGNLGWKYACYFAAGISALTWLLILLLRGLARRSPATDSLQQKYPSPHDGSAGTPHPTEGADYSHAPDLAWLGWVCAGVGVIIITYVRAVFPVRGETSLHLTQSFQGVLFFLISMAQGWTGLALIRSRFWMYRPSALTAFGILGVTGTLVFGFGQSPWLLCAGAILFGIYSGSFFSYLVFHALIHPRRSSLYVAVNETVVGICSMLGAVLGGTIADRFGFGPLYASGATMIFLVLILQGIIHRRRPVGS